MAVEPGKQTSAAFLPNVGNGSIGLKQNIRRDISPLGDAVLCRDVFVLSEGSRGVVE
jgi:hypothetical protein